MEPTKKKQSRNLNIRFTEHGFNLLDAMAERTGLKYTALVETAVREKAERDGIYLGEPKKED